METPSIVDEVRTILLNHLISTKTPVTPETKIMAWKLARDYFTNCLSNGVEKANLVCELDLDILGFQDLSRIKNSY